MWVPHFAPVQRLSPGTGPGSTLGPGRYGAVSGVWPGVLAVIDEVLPVLSLRADPQGRRRAAREPPLRLFGPARLLRRLRRLAMTGSGVRHRRRSLVGHMSADRAGAPWRSATPGGRLPRETSCSFSGPDIAYGRRGVATRHCREQVTTVARWSQSTPTILGYAPGEHPDPAPIGRRGASPTPRGPDAPGRPASHRCGSQRLPPAAWALPGVGHRSAPPPAPG